MTTTIDGSNESTFAAGVTCTSLNGGQLAGRRNIVINGGMKVAQRSASTAGLGSTGAEFVLDRWALVANTGGSVTAGRVTMAQVADGPAGFANCLKLTTTTADTSIAAGEVLILSQRLEGQERQLLRLDFDWPDDSEWLRHHVVCTEHQSRSRPALGPWAGDARRRSLPQRRVRRALDSRDAGERGICRVPSRLGVHQALCSIQRRDGPPLFPCDCE